MLVHKLHCYLAYTLHLPLETAGYLETGSDVAVAWGALLNNDPSSILTCDDVSSGRFVDDNLQLFNDSNLLISKFMRSKVNCIINYIYLYPLLISVCLQRHPMVDAVKEYVRIMTGRNPDYQQLLQIRQNHPNNLLYNHLFAKV